MRNVFREFLYLRKSDRKVILSLLCVIVVALGVIFFAGGNEQSNGLVAADTLSVKRVDKDSFRQKSYPERPKTVYVRTKVVYRDTAYQRGRALHREEHDSAVAHYQVKIKPGEHIMLNTADTTQLKMIPGIGSYFARKVVQYGERLGGYVSVDQLDEIEGFPLDAKEYLVVQDAHPHLLNVNQLSLNELRKHPYINYYRARAITDYRRLHGPLKSLQDLRLSKDFPPEVIERLSPYVAY
jgi:DNA uptake protein ComE-like DNA-binding protein